MSELLLRTCIVLTWAQDTAGDAADVTWLLVTAATALLPPAAAGLCSSPPLPSLVSQARPPPAAAAALAALSRHGSPAAVRAVFFAGPYHSLLVSVLLTGALPARSLHVVRHVFTPPGAFSTPVVTQHWLPCLPSQASSVVDSFVLWAPASSALDALSSLLRPQPPAGRHAKGSGTGGCSSATAQRLAAKLFASPASPGVASLACEPGWRDGEEVDAMSPVARARDGALSTLLSLPDLCWGDPSAPPPRPELLRAPFETAVARAAAAKGGSARLTAAVWARLATRGGAPAVAAASLAMLSGGGDGGGGAQDVGMLLARVADDEPRAFERTASALLSLLLESSQPRSMSSAVDVLLEALGPAVDASPSAAHVLSSRLPLPRPPAQPPRFTAACTLLRFAFRNSDALFDDAMRSAVENWCHPSAPEGLAHRSHAHATGLLVAILTHPSAGPRLLRLPVSRGPRGGGGGGGGGGSGDTCVSSVLAAITSRLGQPMGPSRRDGMRVAAALGAAMGSGACLRPKRGSAGARSVVVANALTPLPVTSLTGAAGHVPPMFAAAEGEAAAGGEDEWAGRNWWEDEAPATGEAPRGALETKEAAGGEASRAEEVAEASEGAPSTPAVAAAATAAAVPPPDASAPVAGAADGDDDDDDPLAPFAARGAAAAAARPPSPPAIDSDDDPDLQRAGSSDGGGDSGGGEGMLSPYELSDDESASAERSRRYKWAAGGSDPDAVPPATLASLLTALRGGHDASGARPQAGEDATGPVAGATALFSAEALIRAAPAELHSFAASLCTALLSAAGWVEEGEEAEAAEAAARRASLVALLVHAPRPSAATLGAALLGDGIDTAQRCEICTVLASAAEEMAGRGGSSVPPPPEPPPPPPPPHRFRHGDVPPPPPRRPRGVTRVKAPASLARKAREAAEAAAHDTAAAAAAARGAPPPPPRTRGRANAFAPVAVDFAAPLLAAAASASSSLSSAPSSSLSSPKPDQPDADPTAALLLGKTLAALGTFARCVAGAPTALSVAAPLLALLTQHSASARRTVHISARAPPSSPLPSAPSAQQTAASLALPVLCHASPFVRRCGYFAAAAAVKALPLGALADASSRVGSDARSAADAALAATAGEEPDSQARALAAAMLDELAAAAEREGEAEERERMGEALPAAPLLSVRLPSIGLRMV